MNVTSPRSCGHAIRPVSGGNFTGPEEQPEEPETPELPPVDENEVIRLFGDSRYDTGYAVADAAISYDDIEEYVNKLCELLASFWAARVDTITSFPIILTEECGLLSNKVNNIYYWDSPIYYLDTPTDVIRMTVFKNNSGETEPDYNVGTPFFCLGEFILYDSNGNKIELRKDMFSTNSLQTHDGSGLAGLCDGDPHTFYHGCYAPNSENGSYAPENAEAWAEAYERFKAVVGA